MASFIDRLLTRQELNEIATRSDLDSLDYRRHHMDSKRLRRAMRDREMLLGHISVCELLDRRAAALARIEADGAELSTRGAQQAHA